MRVPTYTARAATPTQGTGRMLGLQLSTAAMVAPAQASAQAGRQMSLFGERVQDFAFERAKAGAKQEASLSASKLQVEQQALEDKFLTQPNIDAAAKEFARQTKHLTDRYRKNLSNSLARRAFDSKALRITALSAARFTQKNNARVLAVEASELDQDFKSGVKAGSDLSQSVLLRLEGTNEALYNFEQARSTQGEAKTNTRIQSFYKSLGQATLNAFVSEGQDPETMISKFEKGKSSDPILEAVHANLSKKEIAKIAKESRTAANQQRTLRERKDKIERGNAIQDFKSSVSSLLQNYKVQTDMSSETTALNFQNETQQLVDNALEAHTGSAESKASLSLELKRLRTEQMIDFGELQTTARKDNAKRVISQDLRSLVSRVQQDPSSLSSALQTLDQSITESGAAFLNTDQEEDARQAGREDLIESALDGFIARGQTNQARQLFQSTGISEQLTPTIQQNYLNKFREHDERANKFANDLNSKIGAIEAVINRKLTASEKLEISGFKIGQKNKTNFNNTNKLRQEFTKNSKDFLKIQNSYANVLSASEDGTGGSDLSLIFSFMKILDPGSVVRETEFANAQNATGVPSRIRNLFNRIAEGSRLNPVQRRDFVNQAKKLFQTRFRAHLQREQTYKRLAEVQNLDATQVVINLKRFDEQGEPTPFQPAPPSENEQSTETAPVDGQTTSETESLILQNNTVQPSGQTTNQNENKPVPLDANGKVIDGRD